MATTNTTSGGKTIVINVPKMNVKKKVKKK